MCLGVSHLVGIGGLWADLWFHLTCKCALMSSSKGQWHRGCVPSIVCCIHSASGQCDCRVRIVYWIPYRMYAHPDSGLLRYSMWRVCRKFIGGKVSGRAHDASLGLSILCGSGRQPVEVEGAVHASWLSFGKRKRTNCRIASVNHRFSHA